MLRSQEIMLGVPQWARSRCQVVGDLCTDAVGTSPSSVSWALPDKLQSEGLHRYGVPIVRLLPGSKVVSCTLTSFGTKTISAMGFVFS